MMEQLDSGDLVLLVPEELGVGVGGLDSKLLAAELNPCSREGWAMIACDKEPHPVQHRDRAVYTIFLSTLLACQCIPY